MKPHRFAKIFPEMDREQSQLLTASIREHGQQEPIVMYKDKILDGRNRQGACANLQIKPKTIEYTGKDPLGYVLRVNLHRRRMTAVQRSMAAAEVFKLKKGGASIDEIAAQFNVSRLSVNRAKVVVDSDDLRLIFWVQKGSVSLRAAELSLKPEPAPEQSDRFWRKDFERLIATATGKNIKWAAAYLGGFPK